MDTLDIVASLQSEVSELKARQSDHTRLGSTTSHQVSVLLERIAALETHRENLAHVMNRVFVTDEPTPTMTLEEAREVEVNLIAVGDYEELVSLGRDLTESIFPGQRLLGRKLLKLLGVQAEYGEVAS